MLGALFNLHDWLHLGVMSRGMTIPLVHFELVGILCVCHLFCECQFCTSRVKTKVTHLVSLFKHIKLTQVLQGLKI
jgi:hypothetical protein